MKKKYHIVLTPDEPEIIAFKKSLPQGELSKTVATIMTESLKDNVVTIPMNFEIEPVIEDVHTKFLCPKIWCRDSARSSDARKVISPPPSNLKSKSVF